MKRNGLLLDHQSEKRTEHGAGHAGRCKARGGGVPRHVDDKQRRTCLRGSSRATGASLIGALAFVALGACDPGPASEAGAISWFQNRQSQVSAHYVIRSSDGQITQMVEENDTAWHGRNWNGRSIGIEHEGWVDQPRWFTDAMYRSSAALTREICQRWGVPMDRRHILGHVELSGTALSVAADLTFEADQRDAVEGRRAAVAAGVADLTERLGGLFRVARAVAEHRPGGALVLANLPKVGRRVPTARGVAALQTDRDRRRVIGRVRREGAAAAVRRGAIRGVERGRVAVGVLTTEPARLATTGDEEVQLVVTGHVAPGRRALVEVGALEARAIPRRPRRPTRPLRSRRSIQPRLTRWPLRSFRSSRPHEAATPATATATPPPLRPLRPLTIPRDGALPRPTVARRIDHAQPPIRVDTADDRLGIEASTTCERAHQNHQEIQHVVLLLRVVNKSGRGARRTCAHEGDVAS